jgi:uncharacterized protein
MNKHVPPRVSTAAYVRQLLADLNLADLVEHIKSPSYPDRAGNYQYTANGRIFFSCDPRPEEVFIDDIAKQTSRLCRFGGATKQFMSVAEHLWICSYLVPEEEALEALLHDGAEAYINDMIRPLKMLPGLGDLYLKVEKGIELAIAERFKLVYPWPKSVRVADEMVLGREIAENIASDKINHLTTDPESRDAGFKADIKLYFWPAELAEVFFMQRFLELANKRGILG